MNRAWGNGASIGVIYQFKTAADCQRVGNCWMAGRVHIGDYALCLRHAGDYFYEYMLVERIANGWRGIPGAAFGAYVFGETSPEMDLTAREYHLLAAGEFVHRDEWLKRTTGAVLSRGPDDERGTVGH